MSDDDDEDSTCESSLSDSDSGDSVKSEKTRSTRSDHQLTEGDASLSNIGRLQRGMTVAELTVTKDDKRLDSKFVGKLIEYVRVGDGRNVKRLLNKHRSSAAALCVRPLRAAHMWSALTSAADYGHDDIVGLMVSEYGADATCLDGNGWTPLHVAVRKSHCRVIRTLAQCVTSLNVNARSPDGWTPLHIGIRKSAVNTVDMILSYGADVNVTGPRGWTALHLAALVGRRDLVEILLQYGALASAFTDVTHSTAVHVATLNGYNTTVEQLVAGGMVDPDKGGSLKRLTNIDGWTALHMAAASGHVDVVKHLVEQNEPELLNMCNKDGCTALYLAVQNGHTAVTQLLIQTSGVDINFSGKELQWNPLGVAIDKADAPLVNMLIEASCLTVKEDSEGRAKPVMSSADGRVICPLHVALFNKNVELVRRLVTSGVDVNGFYGGVSACHLATIVDTSTSVYIDALIRPSEHHRDDVTCDVNAREMASGRTPLHYAVLGDNDRALKALVGARGVELNAVDDDNWTALMMAAQRGSTDVVQILLAAGCDVNRTSTAGYTALHMAAKGCHFKVVRLLIDFQADVSVTADSGRIQPIHLASISADGATMKLLIDAGADVTATTHSTKRTCLHLAAQFGNAQVVEYLLRACFKRVDVNVTSSGGWTPLHMACQAGNSEIVAELLKYGADDRPTLDDDGETALYVAAAHGRWRVVELLLRHKTVCRKMTSRTGWTELHAAAARGYTDTVEVLVKYQPQGYAGANIDAVNERSRLTGETPLHVAARMGHVDTVRTLVDGGADCEARCSGGLSPLYVAASSSRVEVVRLLVELKPSVVDVNRLNGAMLRTALHVAGNATTALMLIKHGAKYDIRDGPGRTPLKQAIHDNRTDVIELLQKLSQHGGGRTTTA